MRKTKERPTLISISRRSFVQVALLLLGLLAGLVNALTRKRSGKEDEAA